MKARFLAVFIVVFVPTIVLTWAVAASSHASPRPSLLTTAPIPVDVILMLDTSESMAFDPPSGYAYTGDPYKGCKPSDVGTGNVNACIKACNDDPDHPCYPLQNLKDAAKSFVDQLRSGIDQVAVVSYGRDSTTVISFTLNLTASKSAIDSLRATDHLYGNPPGTPCSFANTPGERWKCGTSNPGGALLRAAREFSNTSIVTYTGRFAILISSGGLNSTDPDPASSDPLVQQFGYCPPKNPADPLTRDDPPPCRDQNFSVHHAIDDTRYDAEDFAVDAALHLGLRPSLSVTNGLGIAIFAIGLGQKVVCATGATYDPGPPVVCGNWNPAYEDQGSHLPNTGELFLRFVAAVGDDGLPDTDPCAVGVPSGVQCGNYYFAPTGSSLFSITNEIADQILARAWLSADFGAAPRSGVAPLTVYFTNASAGNAVNTLWDFGDTFTSPVTSPTHTYMTPGLFTVTLRVDYPTGYDILTRTNYITVYAPVSADFSANPLSGVRPLTVTFSNQSLGDFDQVLWDFGDGITNTTFNPTHTYDTSGTYTVALRVSGPGGASNRIREGYIHVLTPEWKFYLPVLIE